MKLNDNYFCDSCLAGFPREEEYCPVCGQRQGSFRQSSSAALPAGTILNARYILGRMLGSGGFGITYLALDGQTQTRVAVKEYYPITISSREVGGIDIIPLSGDKSDQYSDGKEKFMHEAGTIAKFSGSSSIVRVFELFEENNTVYYVMEYLEGCDLHQYMKGIGRLFDESEAVSLLQKMTDALYVVHKDGYLHRDISPDNIYMCNNGDIKLIDFGSARQVISDASQNMTVILKAGFAPLEQYQRNGRQGKWTDIYALGATIYYVLTGKVMDDAMTRISDDSPDMSIIPPSLRGMLAKMLAVDYKQRYQCIEEVRAALNSIMLGRFSPDPIPPVPADSTPRKNRSRRGMPVWRLVLLIVDLAILGLELIAAMGDASLYEELGMYIFFISIPHVVLEIILGTVRRKRNKQ